MILRCSIEMPNISYAWKELKEQLGEDIDSKVKGMVFLKGKQVRLGGGRGSVVISLWFRSFSLFSGDKAHRLLHAVSPMTHSCHLVADSFPVCISSLNHL